MPLAKPSKSMFGLLVSSSMMIFAIAIGRSSPETPVAYLIAIYGIVTPSIAYSGFSLFQYRRHIEVCSANGKYNMRACVYLFMGLFLVNISSLLYSMIFFNYIDIERVTFGIIIWFSSLCLAFAAAFFANRIEAKNKL